MQLNKLTLAQLHSLAVKHDVATHAAAKSTTISTGKRRKKPPRRLTKAELIAALAAKAEKNDDV